MAKRKSQPALLEAPPAAPAATPAATFYPLDVRLLREQAIALDALLAIAVRLVEKRVIDTSLPADLRDPALRAAGIVRARLADVPGVPS